MVLGVKQKRKCVAVVIEQLHAGYGDEWCPFAVWMGLR